ncbi:MAG: MFS transporter [Methanosarcinaceae archaeon]|nr:MFS transporter [Methanosarcinaceae archaeon]
MEQNKGYNELQKKMILAAVCFASFIGPFQGSMINIALPAIGDTFQINVGLYGWVSTSYLLTVATLLVPAARISDIVGRKKVFLTGITGIVATSIITPLTPNFYAFLLCQVLNGVCAACIMSTTVPIISEIFTGKERGAAFGINTAFVYMGVSFGPFIGGFVVSYLGWRSLFLMLLIPALLTAYIMYTNMKEDVFGDPNVTFDKAGTVFYAVSILTFLFGLTRIPETEGFIISFIGLVLLAGFVMFERKQKYPVFDVNLFFENRVFSRSNFASLFNYASTYAIVFFLSLYLQKVGMIEPKTAGLILLVQPLVQAIFSPYAGKLSGVISAKYLATLGMLITSFGLLLLTGLQKDLYLPYLIFTQIVLGLGIAFFAAPNTNMIMSSVSRKEQGSAGGIMATIRQIGMVFSMAVAMSSINYYIGGTENLGPDTIDPFLSSMKLTFIICMILCILGAALSWSRGNIKQELKSES